MLTLWKGLAGWLQKCQSNPSVMAQTRKLRLTRQYRKKQASNRDVALIRYSAVQENRSAGATLRSFAFQHHPARSETIPLIDHTETPTRNPDFLPTVSLRLENETKITI